MQKPRAYRYLVSILIKLLIKKNLRDIILDFGILFIGMTCKQYEKSLETVYDSLREKKLDIPSSHTFNRLRGGCVTIT